MNRLTDYLLVLVLAVMVNAILIILTPTLTYFWLFCGGIALICYTLSTVVGAIRDAGLDKRGVYLQDLK
jgi:hypothetical protein